MDAVYPAPGTVSPGARQLERELAEPVLPRDERAGAAPRARARGRVRRAWPRSGAGFVRIAPRRARVARTRRPARRPWFRNSHWATFWYSGSEKTKKPTSLWNSGSVTPKSRRCSHSTICCQSRCTRLRPTSEPHSRAIPPAARSSRIRRSRRLARSPPGQPPCRRRGALDDPEVGQQEGRRPEPGEAASNPPGSRAASRRRAPARARGTTATRSRRAPPYARAGPGSRARRAPARSAARPPPPAATLPGSGRRARRAGGLRRVEGSARRAERTAGGRTRVRIVSRRSSRRVARELNNQGRSRQTGRRSG